MAGENALDFAHDQGDTSLLDLVSQQMGQVQQEASQDANVDQADAETGQPAPPDQIGPQANGQMGPPAPPVVGAGLAMPQTDNVISQAVPGAGPQVQGPQVSPNPVQNAATPAELRPGPQAEEVQTDARRGETEMRAAEASQEKAKLEQAQAEADFAKETQPIMDYEARIAQDKVNATQAVQNWLTVQQNQIASNTNSDLQRAEAMAMEKPQDYWGNHGTSQKIAAIAGMIGAGLQGKSAAGFMENLVNKDIADYNRRSSALATIRGIHQTQANQFQTAFHNSSTVIDTMAISRYQQAEKALQAKRNQSTSKLVQANYDAAIADLRTKIADDIQKLNNKKLDNLAQQQQFAIQWARLAQEQQQASVKAHGDDGLYFGQAEQTLPDQPDTVPKQVGLQVKKTVDETENLLGVTGDLRNVMHEIDKGGLSVPEAISRSGPLRSELSGLARKLTGVGANLQGGEKATLDDAQITLADYVKGKVTGADLLKKLDVIERIAARRQQTALTENRKGLRLRADSRAGKVLARDEQMNNQDQQEIQQIEQTLARAPNDIAKKAALTMLAKKGNKRAGRMLKEGGASGFIRSLIGSFGKGSDE